MKLKKEIYLHLIGNATFVARVYIVFVLQQFSIDIFFFIPVTSQKQASSLQKTWKIMLFLIVKFQYLLFRSEIHHRNKMVSKNTFYWFLYVECLFFNKKNVEFLILSAVLISFFLIKFPACLILSPILISFFFFRFLMTFIACICLACSFYMRWILWIFANLKEKIAKLCKY